jgi:hypothetical protein
MFQNGTIGYFQNQIPENLIKFGYRIDMKVIFQKSFYVSKWNHWLFSKSNTCPTLYTAWTLRGGQFWSPFFLVSENLLVICVTKI